MNLIRRLFPFRTCTIEIKEGKRALPRPCLLYHIKRCQGPCIEAISKDDYRADIDQVMLFLEGRQELVVRAPARGDERCLGGHRLRAGGRHARQAARRRADDGVAEDGRLRAHGDRRAGLCAVRAAEAAVQLFAIRKGTTVARDVFLLENVGDSSDDEALSAFIKQYYAATISIPPRVLVPSLPPDAAELVDVPRGAPRRARRAGRAAARRAAGADGSRRRATRPTMLAREQARWLADEGKTLAALEELAGALGSADAAAAHRVLRHLDDPGHEHGRQHGRLRGGPSAQRRVPPLPRQDRPCHGQPDDFASHREVLRRRFYRALEAEEGVAEELRWRLPDLVVIDGGLGQVNVAREVLDSLGLHDMPAIGLAKEREEIFLPGINQPLVLPANSQALYLLQRLRDEAHRFAITYHRKLRAKQQTQLGARRGSRRWSGAQARVAACLRLDEADEGRDGRADRVRARHQPRPGRKDPRRPEDLKYCRPSDLGELTEISKQSSFVRHSLFRCLP